MLDSLLQAAVITLKDQQVKMSSARKNVFLVVCCLMLNGVRGTRRISSFLFK